MKLINWNVNRSSLERFKRQAAAISTQNADILALTEVGIKAGPKAANILKEYGFDHVVYSHELRDGTPRMSGVLFASRYPFEVRPNEVAVPEHLWFRVLTADFDTPAGTVEGHVAHVPPGSSTGWTKVEFFQALHKRLAVDCNTHRFLAGDFNSPRKEFEDGSVEVFARMKKEEWKAAERSVIVGLSEHGLPDAFRQVNGYDTFAWSHKLIRHGKVLWRRRFDHIFASPCLNATSAKYLHQFDEHSDHTPLEVVFGGNSRDFLIDGRSTSPNKNNHRRARFKTAWRRAVAGIHYDERTLERLTWANLGWRLGRIFGEISEAEMDELYDWAVRQQQSSRE